MKRKSKKAIVKQSEIKQNGSSRLIIYSLLGVFILIAGIVIFQYNRRVYQENRYNQRFQHLYEYLEKLDKPSEGKYKVVKEIVSLDDADIENMLIKCLDTSYSRVVRCNAAETLSEKYSKRAIVAMNYILVDKNPSRVDAEVQREVLKTLSILKDKSSINFIKNALKNNYCFTKREQIENKEVEVKEYPIRNAAIIALKSYGISAEDSSTERKIIEMIADNPVTEAEKVKYIREQAKTKKVVGVLASSFSAFGRHGTGISPTYWAQLRVLSPLKGTKNYLVILSEPGYENDEALKKAIAGFKIKEFIIIDGSKVENIKYCNVIISSESYNMRKSMMLSLLDYVKAGGNFLVIDMLGGLNCEDRASLLEIMGIKNEMWNWFGNDSAGLRILEEHPILKDVDKSKIYTAHREGNAYKNFANDGVVLAKLTVNDLPAIRLRNCGKGRVLHYNYHLFAGDWKTYGTPIYVDKITEEDIFSRSVECMLDSKPIDESLIKARKPEPIPVAVKLVIRAYNNDFINNADRLVSLGDYSGAEKEYEKCKNSNTDIAICRDAQNGIIKCREQAAMGYARGKTEIEAKLQNTRKYAEAIQDLLDKYPPENKAEIAEKYRYLGSIWFSAQDYEKAEKAFERVKEFDEKGKFTEMINKYQTMIKEKQAAKRSKRFE